MVNHPHNNLFNRGDTERQIKIAFSGGTITNKEMHQGSFELTESLCSEQSLVFGTCEASALKFKVHNVFTSLIGETLTVSEILNGNAAEPFFYGKYKVQSDVPTADRKYRDVVAYDALYDILNADVASWYNNLTFPCSIGYFRKQFLKHFKIEYVDTELVNDGIYIKKTIDAEELSGKTVINAICELNGCFGHINRQGKFEFITLKEHKDGLFPSENLYPSDSLFPIEPEVEENLYKSKYISCKYEDFETQVITGIQIKQEEDDIGVQIGTVSNMYVIENNFLVYGKSASELEEIANNLFFVISKVTYIPISNLKTNGKPYIEVGDRLFVSTTERIIKTYVLERTLKAVNGQKDTFSSKGTEVYTKKVNGLSRQFTQLQGKYNKLTRTVDETRLEMGDMEKELYSTISVTASDLRSEFTDTANGLQSQINQNAGRISLKVGYGEVVNEINVSTDVIELKGNRLIVDSTNFKLDAYGNVTVTGEVNASSGKIGNIEIYQFGLILGEVGNGSVGVLTNDHLNINKVYANEIGGYFYPSHIYGLGGSGLLEVTCYVMDVSGQIECDSIQVTNGIGCDYVSATNGVYCDDLSCNSINGYAPITTENIESYIPDVPDIVITNHSVSGYGSYYYGTNSTAASNLNKSIPTMQWVKDYFSDAMSDVLARLKALESAI